MRIFVGGAQRSGTSLVRSILGSHSKVAFFPYDLKLWTRYRDEFSDLDVSLSSVQDHVINSILCDEKVVIAADVPSLKSIRKALKENSGTPRSVEEVFDAFLSAYAQRRNCELWGLKTPWNEFHAADILDFFSDAVFVHVIRDPRKSALSAMHVDGGSWFYDPALHIRRWKKSANSALLNSKRFGNRYLVIRYEDLISDPRGTVKALVDSIGLDYEQGMENGLGQPGWDGSNSSFTPAKSGGLTRMGPKLPFDLEILYSRRLTRYMTAFDYPVGNFSIGQRSLASLIFSVRLTMVWGMHRVIDLKRFARMRARSQ